MSKLAEVTKIVLDIDGKEIELTPEDAKALYFALKELVGEKEVITVPSPYPVYPYKNPWRYVHPNPYGNPWIITWNATNTITDGIQATWTNSTL
jgi:hypothetical protein